MPQLQVRDVAEGVHRERDDEEARTDPRPAEAAHLPGVPPSGVGTWVAQRAPRTPREQDPGDGEHEERRPPGLRSAAEQAEDILDGTARRSPADRVVREGKGQ